MLKQDTDDISNGTINRADRIFKDTVLQRLFGRQVDKQKSVHLQNAPYPVIYGGIMIENAKWFLKV